MDDHAGRDEFWQSIDAQPEPRLRKLLSPKLIGVVFLALGFAIIALGVMLSQHALPVMCGGDAMSGGDICVFNRLYPNADYVQMRDWESFLGSMVAVCGALFMLLVAAIWISLARRNR